MDMTRADDRKSASVFIVDNTATGRTGNRILWAAGLVGGCVACPWHGSYIVFKRGLRTHRILWISDEFSRRSPATTAIIKALVSGPMHRGERRWTLHANYATFAHVAGRAGPRNKSRFVGLKAEGEDVAGSRIFLEQSLLKLIAIPEPSCSVLGAQG